MICMLLPPQSAQFYAENPPRVRTLRGPVRGAETNFLPLSSTLQKLRVVIRTHVSLNLLYYYLWSSDSLPRMHALDGIYPEKQKRTNECKNKAKQKKSNPPKKELKPFPNHTGISHYVLDQEPFPRSTAVNGEPFGSFADRLYR